jgi:hypothetical protein
MFKPAKFELFVQAIPGVVIKPIAIFQVGQFQLQGGYWRAQLHKLCCHVTLLPGQPALAIGRKNITIIVIPIQCILWEQYLLDDFADSLNFSDLQLIQRYENLDDN